MNDDERKQLAYDPELERLIDDATLTERYAAQDRAHDAAKGLSGDECTRAMFAAFKCELRQTLLHRQTTGHVMESEVKQLGTDVRALLGEETFDDARARAYRAADGQSGFEWVRVFQHARKTELRQLLRRH